MTSSIGHLFDLNPLKKDEGYTVHHHKDQKMVFRINICGSVANTGCSPATGTSLQSASC